jgi:hypothetical protein
MALYKFTNGTVANANEVNENFAKSISFPILNKIRQQQDRSVSISLNKDDIFSDAYIDSNGRENTVNTGNTTATFNSTDLNYFVLTTASADSADERYPTSGYQDDNDYDDKIDFFCSNASSSDYIYVKKLVYHTRSAASATIQVYRLNHPTSYLTTYWQPLTDAVSATSITGSVANWTATFDLAPSDYTQNGQFIAPGERFIISLRNPNTSSASFYFKDQGAGSGSFTYSGTLFDIEGMSPYGGNVVLNRYEPDFTSNVAKGITVNSVTLTGGNSGIVEHDIPSGTFPSDVDKLIGKALIEETESGATIEHRLENATENSGWISDGELGSFTAFTSEPTKYKVRLTAASTVTNLSTPKIKGSGVYSE